MILPVTFLAILGTSDQIKLVLFISDWNFTRATWFRVSDDESLFNYANVSNISGHYIGEAVMTDWKVCVDSTNWLNGSVTMNGTQLIYNSVGYFEACVSLFII
jgi:hypothetical protein